MSGIQELADDEYSVLLDVALTRPNDRETYSVGHAIAAGGQTASKATLLGLLNYLMERSRLHYYNPGEERGWTAVAGRLREAAARGRIGRIPLAQRIYVVPEFSAQHREDLNRDFYSFLARFGPRLSKIRRFFILGELRSRSSRGGAVIVQLRHHNLVLTVPRRQRPIVGGHWWNLYGRYPTPGTIGRALGLYLVEWDGARLRVVCETVALASTQYIPAASFYEVQAAERLVAEARRFDKPMRVDRVTGYMADFRLLDTCPPWLLEVAGYADKDYVDHLDLKDLAYGSNGYRVWRWNAAGGEKMPDFPPPESPHRSAI